MNGFPDMDDAIGDWASPARFQKVTKENVDFETAETVKEEIFSGIIVPMEKQRVQLKPEGERSWRWYQLITEKLLRPDDQVKALDDPSKGKEGVLFRVMAVEDWSMAGYYNYDLSEPVQS